MILRKKISQIKTLKEINKYRIILNKKIAENKESEEVLKISKEIDTLVVFYYKICT